MALSCQRTDHTGIFQLAEVSEKIKFGVPVEGMLEKIKKQCSNGSIKGNSSRNPGTQSFFFLHYILSPGAEEPWWINFFFPKANLHSATLNSTSSMMNSADLWPSQTFWLRAANHTAVCSHRLHTKYINTQIILPCSHTETLCQSNMSVFSQYNMFYCLKLFQI